MNAKEIEESLTDMVNQLIMPKEQKEQMRDTIFKLILVSSKRYLNDREFRQEMDGIAKYFLEKERRV